MLAVVEAKNDDVWNGFGQCVATMYAARLMNEKAALPPAPVYGASTTGLHWKFFELRDTILTIDAADYTLMTQVDQIAGILLSMV